ncbi:PAS domain S-box protein [Leptolyngbya iicbica]|uniref:Circadian input-output histidine kinase CikA n=2 Tax=Cyanophyceae TaxID=3028117 RepID=A0A4Q7E7M7_9CYAN|nr:PAS domain S-box protein [Leptolyngbya sp. LK]RZM76625.1 PAS domain S-box protein [Leptolyngbya sp. LK]
MAELSNLRQQLAAAQVQIQQLSHQLTTERATAAATQAQLTDQLNQQTEQLHALEAKTEQLQHLINASPATTYRCEAAVNYGCTFITPNIQAILGYSPEAVLSEPQFWPQRLHPDDTERALADLAQLFEQGHLVNEYRFRHRDGHYVWLRDERNVLLDDQGDPATVVGYFTDISEQKRLVADRAQTEQRVEQELQRIAEENQQFRQVLAEQAATYRHLFDGNPQPMWVYDLETLQFLAVNDAAIAKYGYSRAEFLAMTIADIRPAADVPRLLANVAQVDTGLDLAGIWQHCLRNGQIIQVEIVSYALEFEGRRAELVMAQDITPRVAAQQALQELNRALEQTVAERTAALHQSQAEIQAVLNNSPFKIYVEDLAGRYRFVNQAFLTLLDRQLEEVLGKTPFDLFPAHIAEQFRANEQSLITQGNVQQFEEVVLIDGEERTLLSHKFWLRDAQGEAYGLCGMSIDITDRKAMEAELEDSRDRLQAVITALPDLVFRMTREGRYLDFYPSAFTPNIGSLDDLTGHLMTDVLPVDIAQAHLFRIERALRTQKLCVSEQRIELHGQVRYEEVRVRPCGADEVVFVIRDITARKQQDLQIQHQLAAIEAAVNGIAILQNDQYLYLNRAHLDLFGYTQPELVGQPWTMLYGPDELARIEQDILPIVARDGAWSGNVRATRKDGTTFDEGISLTLTPDGLLICVCEDISDRKAAERASRASQAFLQTVLDTAPIAIFWKDVQGIYRGGNAKTVEVFGLSSLDELLHHTDQQMAWPPEIVEAIQAQDRQIITTQEPCLNIEQHLVTTTGVEVWVEINKVPLCDENGQITGILGTAQDVTQRKRAETELQNLTDRLSLALEASAIGTWDWDLAHEVSWDAQMHTIYDLQHPDDRAVYETWSNSLHPDDRERVEALLQAALRGEADYETEFRIRRPDGELRWLYAIALVQRDPQGHPTRVVGINQDITDRKAAEGQLLHLSNRLSLALDAGQLGVWSWDLDQQLYWDAALCRMYGIPETSQLNSWQAWRSQIHRDDIGRVEALMQAAIEGAPYTGVEFRIWHTNGELRWMQSFAQVQRDDQGRPVQLVGLNRDITHRKRAELDLVAYAHEIEDLYNNAPCGYCSFDAEDRVTRINDTALRWLDYPREAVLGQPMTQFITVASHATYQAQKALLVESGQLSNLEYEITLLGRDGAHLQVLMSEQLEKDETGNILGSRATLVDIRQRLKAERLLKQQFVQEKQLREITQHMRQSLDLSEILPVVTQQVKQMLGGDRVIVFQLLADGHSRIAAEAVSPEFLALHEQPWADEVWPQQMLEVYCQGQPRIVPDGMPNPWTDCPQDYARQGQIQSKIVAPILTDLFESATHRRVNPQPVRKLWGVLVVHAGQEPRQWRPSEAQRLQQVADQLAISIQQAHLFEQLQQELGDRQRAEQQLAERNQQLSVSNQELARATRLKDEFLANMSHELRTPLNAILGMAEGLQEEVFGPVTERQQRSLVTIERSGTHLLSLINDILDLSKIEAGQLELEFAVLDVDLLCQSSLTFVKQQAYKKQLQLTTQMPSRLPALYGDERRLRQVLINLLTNAVKFTPAGGQVTLSVTYTPFTLELARRHDIVHPQADAATTVGVLALAVTDTGIGISAENAQKLFQPFVQVDTALNRQHEGTGLGLALVKRIAELHGGQVELTSEVDRGSCFTVRLPILATAAATMGDRPARMAAPGTVDRDTAPLLLLVEDNEANIATTTAYLTAKGYYLIVANTGLEAIHLAQTTQPDLILMDVQMPEMDGFEAIAQLRQNPDLAAIPIIAVTALAMESDRDRCLAAGATAYISKPIRLKQLAQTIQELLQP